MASAPPKTLQARRLVAGGIDDVDHPRVVAVGELAATLAALFGVAAAVALAIALLVVHGQARIVPLIAAVGGALWGYELHRRAIRRAEASYPSLPSAAVIVPHGALVVMMFSSVTVVGAAVAFPVLVLGHGSTAAIVTASCILPVLYTRMVTGSLLARRAARRHSNADGGRALYQTFPKPRQRATLYSDVGVHAG